MQAASAGSDAPSGRVSDADLLASVPAAYRLALALCGDQAAAQDLVHSAVVRVLARSSAIENIGAYLRRTVANLHIDGLRHMSHERRHLASAGAELMQHTDPDTGTRVDLERALASLSPEARTIVVLRFLEDRSAQQVARMIGRPAGTVRRITHEALAVLRRSSELAATDVRPAENDGHCAHVEGDPRWSLTVPTRRTYVGSCTSISRAQSHRRN